MSLHDTLLSLLLIYLTIIQTTKNASIGFSLILTIDILIKLIRIPAIFQGSKESISTLKLLLKKITDFEGIAISDKALTADSLVQFPVTLPCKLEELYDLLRKYKEQAMREKNTKLK